MVRTQPPAANRQRVRRSALREGHGKGKLHCQKQRYGEGATHNPSTEARYILKI